ncbi:unnamed protein product [Pylaiella littoralis]
MKLQEFSPSRMPLLLFAAALMVVIIPGSKGFLVVPCAAAAGSRPVAMERRSSSGSRSEMIWPAGVAGSPFGGLKTSSSVAVAMGGKNDGSVAADERGAGSRTTCTCRNCNQQFRRSDNAGDACSFHPGLFTGRLNRVNDVDTSGLEYFWSCCGQPEKSHPGCATGSHASYDDPPEGGDGAWRSPLTGTLR